jgi:hypothetical protein
VSSSVHTVAHKTLLVYLTPTIFSLILISTSDLFKITFNWNLKDFLPKYSTGSVEPRSGENSNEDWWFSASKSIEPTSKVEKNMFDDIFSFLTPNLTKYNRLVTSGMDSFRLRDVEESLEFFNAATACVMCV